MMTRVALAPLGVLPFDVYHVLASVAGAHDSAPTPVPCGVDVTVSHPAATQPPKYST